MPRRSDALDDFTLETDLRVSTLIVYGDAVVVAKSRGADPGSRVNA